MWFYKFGLPYGIVSNFKNSIAHKGALLRETMFRMPHSPWRAMYWANGTPMRKHHFRKTRRDKNRKHLPPYSNNFDVTHDSSDELSQTSVQYSSPLARLHLYSSPPIRTNKKHTPYPVTAFRAPLISMPCSPQKWNFLGEHGMEIRGARKAFP